MTLLDFIIGALLANAMPHLIFGLTKTHFLGMFGYSPKGNIIYAILQFALCIFLFCYNYGYAALVENGYLVGGITVLVLYFIFGKLLVQFYGKQKKTTIGNSSD
jgi:NO-binding membrane sensor protein with MHYT domain